MVNLTSKIFIINKFKTINIDQFSESLSFLKIENLKIICINDELGTVINIVNNEKNGNIIYMEMDKKNFIQYLNDPNFNFVSNNKQTLYIVRNGSFL